MKRVPFQDLYQEFFRVLVRVGVSEERGKVIARLFAENQRDGVYSHGLNRFGRFIGHIRKGQIDVHANPEKTGGFGSVEQWDGKMGMGLWNAFVCMGRAVELANERGVGCVGVRNTNHLMRAGSYALQAADAGCIGICWTNTIPLMPPWGSAEVRIGNNPISIAVPRRDGHLLLDMAMSQYSNGRLEVSKQRGQEMAVAAGYDSDGNLTRNPGAVLASRRALPIGYWKGSAFAMILDAMATVVSGGRSSHQIGREGVEHGVSQVFLAINATELGGEVATDEALNAIVDDLHTAAPHAGGGEVRYPGEGMMRNRQESLAKGVLVDETLFEALLAM